MLLKNFVYQSITVTGSNVSYENVEESEEPVSFQACVAVSHRYSQSPRNVVDFTPCNHPGHYICKRPYQEEPAEPEPEVPEEPDFEEYEEEYIVTVVTNGGMSYWDA